MKGKALAVAALAAYVATIVGANWAINAFGGEDHAVSIGLGLSAPAGVYFAGLAFTCRDLIQRWGSLRLAALAVALGSVVSYVVGFDGKVSPDAALGVAAASALAFAASELADLGVYTWLKGRGFVRAVAYSNAVGLVVDSVVFLWLAFGSLQFITGQIVGKAYMTALAVMLILAIRRARKGCPVALYGQPLQRGRA